MFFNSSVNNTFLWCISQFLLLNTSSLLFPQAFLLINSISFSFNILNLKSTGNFHSVSQFLAISSPFYECCESCCNVYGIRYMNKQRLKRRMERWKMNSHSVLRKWKMTSIPCAVKTHQKYFFNIISRTLRSKI